MAYIDIKNLTKKYQDRSGIFDINLSIAKGECLGIIGINGAGKSTLIRHLMGFCKPRTGSITIDNLDA
jgi:ABC-2 type transport system ATP-binding protein